MNQQLINRSGRGGRITRGREGGWSERHHDGGLGLVAKEARRPRPGLAAKRSSCLGRAGRSGYQAQALSSDPDIGPVGPLGLPGPRHVWALDVLGFFMMYGRPALETDQAKFAANSRAIFFFDAIRARSAWLAGAG